jgi:hypothetical protein
MPAMPKSLALTTSARFKTSNKSLWQPPTPAIIF